jgi:hypothetical protein
MTFKKAVIRGLIGIPVGVFINVTIMLIISLSLGKTVNYESAITDSPLSSFLFNYIISMIVGFTFAFGSAIFEVDKWSITKQTFLHFILTTCVFIPSAIIGGWTQPDIVSILIYIVVFVILYVLIWLIQYYYWKKRIKKINEKLKN